MPEAATKAVLWKKGVHKSFAKFRVKHLCHSLLLNKLAGLRPVAFEKECCKTVKNNFFT